MTYALPLYEQEPTSGDSNLPEDIGYEKATVSSTQDFQPQGGDVFDKLVNNRVFIAEAKEARRKVLQNPTHFTNFTEKYSRFIK